MIHGGDIKKWDCQDCLSYRLNEQRNCGGNFPDSRFGKTGYEISDFKIFECPKTYIKAWTLDFIRCIDRARNSGIPITPSLGLLPNKFVALWEIAEIEKTKVRIALHQIEKKEGG